MSKPVKTSAVVAKKPRSMLTKPVKLQPVKFVAALAKGIYDAATGGWKELGKDIEQAIDATGLKTEPGEVAWKLILRAVFRALFDLIEETEPFPADSVLPDRARFTLGLEIALGQADLVIERRFFERPENFPLLATISPPLVDWLVAHGATTADATCIVKRLPSYFAYALHQEWRERAAEYAPLLQALDTPFAKADERGRAWERYAARLQRQINEPMLAESFGIAHVYVPLYGYYEEQEETSEPGEMRRMGVNAGRGKVKRCVLDVEEALATWSAASGKDELALRVIAGGPGSGKSSLTGQRTAVKGGLAQESLARLKFSGQLLHFVDLCGADLSFADFEHAGLHSVGFEQACLVGANFESAHLSEANFIRATLAGANFRDADLSGANLEGANLRGANFGSTPKKGVGAPRRGLEGANLEDADLGGANLKALSANITETPAPSEFTEQGDRFMIHDDDRHPAPRGSADRGPAQRAAAHFQC